MKLKYFIILFFVFMFFCSCSNESNGLGYKIKKADSVTILFNESGNIYKHSDTSKSLIANFIKVLDGKVGKRKCSVMGEIAFYSKKKLLFEAGFSFAGGKEGCQYLMAGDSAWQLTYNTGMYLGETLADLKRDK